MKKNFSLLLIVALGFILTGCGKTETNNQLVVFNYSDYIEEDVIYQFEKETGIDVVYEEYVTPESMYSKYQTGATKYDLICTSDYIIEKMRNDNELLELDKNNIPNLKNIGDIYMDYSQAFDPDNKYAVPHFWGTVGLLYNTTMVDEADVHSWNILWDEKYSGQIVMQNSMRDSFVPALKLLGYSINTTNPDELKEAQQLLIKQRPLVQSYLVDEARDEIVSENAAIALVYSGEAYLGQEYNEDLAYAIPEEGSNVWIDSWVIPSTCQNKEAAEKFIDFLCREDIALKNFEYIYYATPNDAVKNNSLDEEILSDESVFPSLELMKKCEIFRSLDENTTSLYNDLWIELKASE